MRKEIRMNINDDSVLEIINNFIASDRLNKNQILQLIKDIQREENMSVLLITHDLGVVAETCEKVAVMYKGKIVEQATVDEIFSNPKNDYTKGLLEAIPKGSKERLKVPNLEETSVL